MTAINLPRATVEQALEALVSESSLSAVAMQQRMDAITALRAALAQQAEPVEPVATITECEACFTPDVCQLRGTCDHYAASQLRVAAPPQQAEPAGTRALIEECLAAFAEELAGWDIDPPLHHVKQAHDKCEAWLAALAQQAEPVDTDCHTQGICQRSGYGIGKQAEPVEPVAWVYTGIKQDGTEHGPHLVWKPEYMDAMSASKGAKATPLYTAPPQRKPLTEEEIDAIGKALLGAGYGGNTDREFARAVERAHGIGRQTDPQIEDRLARHGIPKP